MDLVGRKVKVRLKWGPEYIGQLESADAYMNLCLNQTEEFIDQQFAGSLGKVLIRCNNVLYIQAKDDDEAKDEPTKKDAEMEE